MLKIYKIIAYSKAAGQPIKADKKNLNPTGLENCRNEIDLRDYFN